MELISNVFKKNKLLLLLRAVPLFSDLSDDELSRFQEKFLIKQFKKNDIILDEQETGKYFYVILKGVVRIVKPLDGGRERVLALHREGDFFGELAIFDGQTSPARMVAREPVEILFIKKEDFKEIVLINKQVNEKLIHFLCERLRESWGQIKTLTSLTAEKRICKALCDITRRHGEKTEQGIKIMMQLSHQEIADIAATSRETVTRTLLALQEQNIILKGIKKYIVILDSDRLMNICDKAIE
jgi:CRP/FNR family transcriptional regulator